ncbi:MAG: ABC transporter transmembrane domain-containing protein [Halothiobacillaceae bacterium]
MTKPAPSKTEDGTAGRMGLHTYRRLLGYVRPHWRIFALAILGMIAASLTDVAFAALMKPLLDGSFVAKDLATTQWVPLALVGVFLVRAVGEFGAKYGMTWVARKVVSTLRQQVFDKLLRLPTRFFDHAQSGDLLARLTYTVEQVASAATGALTVLVRDGLSVIGLLAWMFWLSPQLTVFILVVAPIVVALVAIVSRNFRRYSRRIQASVGEIAQVADDVPVAVVGNPWFLVIEGQVHALEGRLQAPWHAHELIGAHLQPLLARVYLHLARVDVSG